MIDCASCKYSGRPSYKSPCSECLARQIVKTGKRIFDYTEVRNAFDEQFKKTRELILSGETHLDNLAEGFTEADRVIRSMPIVDAVEVVRCKDCIHWYEPEGICLKIYSDGAVSPYAWQYRNADDFCSYGERTVDNGKETQG